MNERAQLERLGCGIEKKMVFGVRRQLKKKHTVRTFMFSRFFIILITFI